MDRVGREVSREQRCWPMILESPAAGTVGVDRAARTIVKVQ